MPPDGMPSAAAPAAEAGSDTPAAAGAQPQQSSGKTGLRRATLLLLALAVLVFFYYVFADRTTPFSSDGRVQAFVLRMAPEVTGQVQDVPVADNAMVDAETVLFTIDPTPFRIAVEQAEANLAQIGQSIGASTAAIEVSQAKLDEVRAAEANTIAQSRRIMELVRQGVYPRARRDDALADIDRARAATKSAEADLRRAREELGSGGEDNPRIRDALATLERAKFQLSLTSVSAPSRGVVANLQLAVGDTVVAGQPAMTFISAEDIWLLAAFRENSIGVLDAGDRAEVVLDALPGQVFGARLTSVGWGIAGGAIDPATGLPKIAAASGWLGDAQRFPVQFVFDEDNLPYGVRYGSKAAVIVYASGNGFMNAIAWLRIRLIAMLTFLS